MAENADTRPKEGAVIPVTDTPHAPFIFFDGAPAFGHANGVFNLTLAAGRTWVGPDSTIATDQVVVAYLRGNVQAMLGLRHAIDSLLLLVAPTQEGKAN